MYSRGWKRTAARAPLQAPEKIEWNNVLLSRIFLNFDVSNFSISFDAYYLKFIEFELVNIACKMIIVNKIMNDFECIQIQNDSDLRILKNSISTSILRDVNKQAMGFLKTVLKK